MSESFEDSQKIAKEKLVRAKFYKIMAIAFAFGAFVVMVYIHRTLAKGQPMEIIENPVLIAVLLLPFLPSWFLAILSKKRRAQAFQIMEPHMETVEALRAKAKE